MSENKKCCNSLFSNENMLQGSNPELNKVRVAENHQYSQQGSRKDCSFKTGCPQEGQEIHMETVSEIGVNSATDEKMPHDRMKKQKTSLLNVRLFQMFRYSNCFERILIVIGTLSAWAAATCLPIGLIATGYLVNAMTNLELNRQTDDCKRSIHRENRSSNYTNDWFKEVRQSSNQETDLQSASLHFFIISTVVILAQLNLLYVSSVCLNLAAERQIHRLKSLFMKAALRQEMSWYDAQSAADLCSHTAENFLKLQDGMGDKFGSLNFLLANSITYLVISLVYGWKMTLVQLSATPVIVIATAVAGKFQSKMAITELKAYGKAGAIAQEVLAAVRTVVSFGGEAKEVSRYEIELDHATKAGIQCGLIAGGVSSLYWFFHYGNFAITLWYGIKLLIDEQQHSDQEFNPQSLTIVFYSIMYAGANLGLIVPVVEKVVLAIQAATSIHEFLGQEPMIDIDSVIGIKPPEIKGNLKFDCVSFSYPTRPSIMVLEKFSVEIGNGQTLALVGESGCGKSTIVQLLLRLYDPVQGSIYVDGHDIKTLNLGWLRDSVAVVGQEPVLFNTTIVQNIMYGLKGATIEDVERAAREANAHDFIMNLPHNYETIVGDRGTQLSGGQKQRVAIARALIRKSKILVLDEATSALDSENEDIVTQALIKTNTSRTTIIVAHRLSTIRNASKILVLSKGQIVEFGTHEELMSQSGIYRSMFSAQSQWADIKGEPSFKEQDSTKMLPMNMVASCQNHALNCIEEVTKANCQTAEKFSMTKAFNILKLHRKEWHYVVLGCIGSIGTSLSYVAMACLLGYVFELFAMCDTERMSRDSIFYACLFLVLGIVNAVFNFLKVIMFSFAGEKLTHCLRKMTLAAMLKQEMGWFDDPRNSIGALCTLLSSDTYIVQNATGLFISIVLQLACSLIATSVLMLNLSWKIALVGMSIIPVICASIYFESKIKTGSLKEIKALEATNKIAIEVISNIRTVMTLHVNDVFYGMYVQSAMECYRNAVRRFRRRGLMLGITQSVPLYVYRLCTIYVSYLILNEGLQYGTGIRAIKVLIFGTIPISQAIAFIPTAMKGVASASRIIQMLERQPEIDSSCNSGMQLNDPFPGQMNFHQVSFSYPTRKNALVLLNLSLTLEPGKVMAMVGSSGCGKSTCIQLLQRFYDPNSGELTMDGVGINNLGVRWLRSVISIVTQEPILFNRSIADNIAYGDNSRYVPMEDIIKAAIDANIHQFISHLPQGYDTLVGDKGTQLSGGQKQRIAIARALVCNPAILILDEATSALDRKSEKAVLEALTCARNGRTVLMVAHRLSTIQMVDKITVIKNGRMVEEGSHEDLMKKHGQYYRLYRMQALSYI